MYEKEYEIFVGVKQEKHRCEGCDYCRRVFANGGWSFYGCYHEPYHGKWIAEIKDCPTKE